MRTLVANLRHSVRMLRKNPGLTASVLITLMLGIGATTAVYTVVYASLLAPLPYPQPQQLVILWSRVDGQRNVLSAGDFLDWKRESHSFQQLTAWDEGSFNIAEGNEPEQLTGRLVTPGYFNMQGIPFFAGRDFLPEEGVPGKNLVVVLTNRLWKRLGADPAAVGKAMRINGLPYTVVGVLSPGFADRLGPELIVPLAFSPSQINHNYHWLVAMGRLKQGVSLQQAQADMDGVTARIAAAYPDSNKGWGASVEPLRNDFLPPDRIRNLWLLLGSVGFVLLITCVNIANLLLAKGAARQREIAIRTSMGASRFRIFGQFLTESLLLALGGGVLGIGLGAGLLRLIVSITPDGILPSEANFHLDGSILALAFGVTTIAGILFGCAPAWYASRVDPAEFLRDGGRSATGSGNLRLRRLLIIGEFGLALSLLAGAGLAVHSFWNLTRADLGVRTEHVLTFSLNQPAGRFANADAASAYYQSMLRSIGSVSGVRAVAAVTGLPLRGTSNGMPFSIVGQASVGDPSRRPDTGFQAISPGYLQAFGVRLLQGRGFTPQDDSSSVRVALVNEEFVKRYIAGLDPLRQRVAMEQILPGGRQFGPIVEWQIVGVTHNVLSGGFREPHPEMDVPFAQSTARDVNIGLGTDLDPAAMARTVAAAVHSVDPEVALAHVRTMDEVKADALGEDLFTMRLFASFAAIALLLAAVGIYGLMAYTVTQRTQEMGLRLALGSGRAHIVWLVLREALLLALGGIAIGAGGALALQRLMRTTLYGIGSLDLVVLLAVALTLVGTALLSAYLPARRASTVDPMEALRTE